MMGTHSFELVGTLRRRQRDDAENEDVRQVIKLAADRSGELNPGFPLAARALPASARLCAS